jgi:hypothetical protein
MNDKKERGWAVLSEWNWRGGGSKPLLQHIKTKILSLEDELLVKLVNTVDTGF